LGTTGFGHVRRRSVDGSEDVSFDGTSFIDSFTNDVDNSAEAALTDGDLDGGTGVDNFLTSGQSFGGVHSNGSDGVLTQVLGDFEDQSVFSAWDFEGVEDRGSAFVELDIDDGTDDGHDLTGEVSNALTGD